MDKYDFYRQLVHKTGFFMDKPIWKLAEKHRSRNLRHSAAQSKLRSSAQGLLRLLCACSG